MKLTNEEFKQLRELQKKNKKDLGKSEVEVLKTLLKKKASKDECPKSEFHPGNDFSWWNKEPQLMADAANLKSKYIAGKPVAGNKIPFVVPGILRVRLASAYGAEETVTDPINVWARDFYLKFYQKYRGASGFSASDLAVTLFAENEIVKLIAKYERIYGIVNRYSRLNANIPHSEVRGVGITQATANYLRNHLSDFRYDLNVLIRKAQRLCIPKDLSSIADAISMFGYEYMDHDSVRSQIIVYDLCKYLEYDETKLTTGGALFPVYIDGLNLFVEDGSSNMCRFLDQALNALLRSDSVQSILANMVVWFGEGSMLEFKPVPEDYVVVPVKDDTMLHKLHNIDVVCTDNCGIFPVIPSGMDAADITTLQAVQDLVVFQFNDTIHTKFSAADTSGTITWQSIGSNLAAFSTNQITKIISNDCPHMIDTYRAEADPEVVVEGSLFKYSAQHWRVSSKHAYVFNSLALYYCYGFELLTATNVDVNTRYFNFNVEEDAGDGSAQTKAGYLAVVDWAPLFYAQNSSGDISDIAGDIDNPIVIYDNDITRLHQTILYSAFKSDMTVVKG